MDGVLENRNKIIFKFEQWFERKYVQSIAGGFCEDIHLDSFYVSPSNKEWLKNGFAMQRLLQEQLVDRYPCIKVGLLFVLSDTHVPTIPKTFSKRNFGKNTLTPPVLLFYEDEEKIISKEKCVYIDEISRKYNMRAYYFAIAEDVVYRNLYFLP